MSYHVAYSNPYERRDSPPDNSHKKETQASGVDSERTSMSGQSSYQRRGSYRDYGSRIEKDTSEEEEKALVPVRPAVSSPVKPAGFEMQTMSAGGKLAQEIHDEFLVCKICLEGFKSPKCLDCLHTFCEKCIENHVMSESTYKKYSDYREFTCPLCRKRTQLPIGGVKKLPDNFLVSNLTETIGRQRPSKFPFCDICKMVNHKHKEAASKCLDCAKLLCKQCVDLHKETKVTSKHSIFDVEIEKDIECKQHQDEVVRFYCEPCETCICVLCTFNEHKDHEISQFEEAVSKYRENIQVMLDGCKEKICTFDKQLESITQAETVIKAAEQKIHDTAIKFIADVRSKEKSLIEKLSGIYGTELMDLVEHKDEMKTTMEGLRNTCSLTDVILQGKDIELLLLKKDVQKKLQSLGDIRINTLPTGMDKVVVFRPGTMDLGYIDDKDNPKKSNGTTKPVRMRTVPESDDDSDGESDDEVETCNAEVQTELSHKDIKRVDETDEDDDDDDEESDEDDDEEEEKEYEEIGIQTSDIEEEESEEEESDEEGEKPEMVDCGTETDEIPTEEKGVNTRSRSLQSTQANAHQMQQQRMMQQDEDSMKHESHRLKSFQNWPKSEIVSPIRLAHAGFYFTGTDDLVECAFCQGQLESFETGDNPMQEHREHFGKICDFVRGKQNIGNVPLNMEKTSTPPTPPDISKDPDWLKHESHRLKTFYNWPKSEFMSATSLARAGLFFTGSNDSVECAFCHGKLKNFEAGDIPMLEHKTHFGNICGFVQGQNVGNIPLNMEQPDTFHISHDQELMKLESHRLKTYSNWPKSEIVSAINLAKAGLYYTGHDDCVECAFCHGQIESFEVGDDPMQDHKDHYGENCPFIKQEITRHSSSSSSGHVRTKRKKGKKKNAKGNKMSWK